MTNKSVMIFLCVNKISVCLSVSLVCVAKLLSPFTVGQTFSRFIVTNLFRFPDADGALIVTYYRHIYTCYMFNFFMAPPNL